MTLLEAGFVVPEYEEGDVALEVIETYADTDQPCPVREWVRALALAVAEGSCIFSDESWMAEFVEVPVNMERPVDLEEVEGIGWGLLIAWEAFLDNRIALKRLPLLEKVSEITGEMIRFYDANKLDAEMRDDLIILVRVIYTENTEKARVATKNKRLLDARLRMAATVFPVWWMVQFENVAFGAQSPYVTDETVVSYGFRIPHEEKVVLAKNPVVSARLRAALMASLTAPDNSWDLA